MDIVSRIPSTAPKIKTHLPHPPGLGRFSAQDAALFHPSAENTELGTRYDIKCSYSSDKIKQILCFPLRPQMPVWNAPRSAAGKRTQCFDLQYRKEIHHRRSDTGSAQRGQPQPARQRIRRHPRPQRLGQDHAAQHHRRPRPLRQRRAHHQRHLHPPLHRPGLGLLPQPHRRLRVPEL